MNIYEIVYTKQYDTNMVWPLKERKYQIPAENEQQALIRLGQLNPDIPVFPFEETVVVLISIKKVQ